MRERLAAGVGVDFDSAAWIDDTGGRDALVTGRGGHAAKRLAYGEGEITVDIALGTGGVEVDEDLSGRGNAWLKVQEQDAEG